MEKINKWQKSKNSISKTFIFKNFVEAVKFVDHIVPLAESVNHHPDIKIFAYKKVNITLTTHEKKRVTDKDTKLSKKIDEI